MLAHGNNVFCVSLPQPKCDAQGRLTGSDYSALDPVLARFHGSDIVLLFSGHADRTYPSREFINVYSGLDRGGAVWLAERGVVNIGIDALAIDHSDDLEFSGHMVCGEYQIVNTENLTNLHLLAGKRFIFTP